MRKRRTAGEYDRHRSDRIRGMVDWAQRTINSTGDEYWSGTFVAIRIETDTELKAIAKQLTGDFSP